MLIKIPELFILIKLIISDLIALTKLGEIFFNDGVGQAGACALLTAEGRALGDFWDPAANCLRSMAGSSGSLIPGMSV